jgi:hypothetical protein
VALAGAVLQVPLLYAVALGVAVAAVLFGARAWFGEASRGRARGEHFLDNLGHSWESEDERRAVGAPAFVPVRFRLGRHPRVQVNLSGLDLHGFGLAVEEDELVVTHAGREVARMTLLAT